MAWFGISGCEPWHDLVSQTLNFLVSQCPNHGMVGDRILTMAWFGAEPWRDSGSKSRHGLLSEGPNLCRQLALLNLNLGRNSQSRQEFLGRNSEPLHKLVPWSLRVRTMAWFGV
jgi:hypothetical protein